MNFATVDVNFQTVTLTLFCKNFFHFDTNQYQGPTYTAYKISAKYIKPFWRNGFKCLGRRNFFKVNANFQTAIVTLFHYRLFFNLISISIKVPLILHTKFQPNMPSQSGENDDFISFAIFSNGGHLEFSTRLTFTILKPWSLVMLHMKLKTHGCSGLRE